ncbi:myosin-2 isoform X2 [Takifugu rubripes]|uniref:myosin-2 isoform X2 n=1 Tax=Takifugu rubripes TaxID=31033 RepID=UPI001145D27A|nr:myosin-2-like isoform X2 [Takifugu rubripes]
MADRDHDGTRKDTEELLYSDLSNTRSLFLPGRPPVKPAPSVLRGIDACVAQLQLQKPKGFPKASDCSDLASLRWNSFLSKDTGLGSTSQINDTPLSFLDLMPTPKRDNTSDDPVTEGPEKTSDTGTRHQEERESQREQIVWRLKRLLGDACDGAQITVESQPPSESICTEDFLGRFRDEMVDVTLLEDKLQQQKTDQERHKEKRQNLLSVGGKGATASGKSTRTEEDPQYCQKDHVCCNTEAVMGNESLQQNKLSSKIKTLAGVPMQSFDSVSIDSELDSVCTVQVRQYINGQSGWRSLLESDQVRDHYLNQNHCDTINQDENEAHTLSGWGSFGNGRIRGQCSKRETCRPDKTVEKMQSDWFKMKNNLVALQQKCKKEEETLKSKKIQIKHAELSLSELQKRRKHGLQELARLAAEKAVMGKEKNSLEFVLKESRCRQHELQRQGESSISEHSVVMSVLEREEMDRQLDCAKTDLFAEQRRSREKLESMQDKLEETCEHLQIVTDSEGLLRTRCACLEEKQKQDKEKIEAAEILVNKLQGELGECTMKKDTLERTLAQKELQLLEFQEQQRALHAERDGLRGALQLLKSQHSCVVKDAQEQTQRMQKEEETTKLRDSLEQQKQEAKRREAELLAGASEHVKEAIEEERRTCEAEKVEAVQLHCGILEEEFRKRLGNMRSEIQRERSGALALQQEVAELKTRVQEMKRDSCARQREQESLLAAVCQTLKEEHEAKYQRLQKDVTQETQKVVLQLEVAQKETECLRRMLEEQESSCNQINAGLEQQIQQWARDLQAEYQNLHALLDRGAEERSSVQLPVGSTVPEALANLRIVREELKNVLGHLQRQLESQKQASECLRIRMEQEVRLQVKHLRTERDRALKSVKERLIQEHIEELSSLKWAHLSDGGAEGGAAASLRKQLQAKDMELRQVQRRMAQWKAQTAARLAFRFEEELTAELERCKTKLLRGRKTSEPDEKMMSGQDKDQMATVCSSAPPLTASSCSSDVASLKLLRYLQDKVKQLRVENQAFGWSSSSATAVSSHLSGADPATASDQRTRTRWDSQPRSIRTAPS